MSNLGGLAQSLVSGNTAFKSFNNIVFYLSFHSSQLIGGLMLKLCCLGVWTQRVKTMGPTCPIASAADGLGE